ncbi:MAG: hypothetical protein KAS32_13220 [Candidatus Peribacteraceae bacterium]|nr:hypothetical protein [Candidatus Peribacteraceae bacterium]
MPSFSERSKSKLYTCHPDLQKLFNEVVKHWDCTVLWGYRNREQQNNFYNNGASNKKFPESKHNKEISEAIDVTPYPIKWLPKERHYAFSFFVLGIATMMGIKLRLGSDWDGDKDLNDQELFDLNHFELI